MEVVVAAAVEVAAEVELVAEVVAVAEGVAEACLYLQLCYQERQERRSSRQTLPFDARRGEPGGHHRPRPGPPSGLQKPRRAPRPTCKTKHGFQTALI